MTQFNELRILTLRTENLWPVEHGWGYYTVEQVEDELQRSGSGPCGQLAMAYYEDRYPMELYLEPVDFDQLIESRPEICVLLNYDVSGCVGCGGTCEIWQEETEAGSEVARKGYQFYTASVCNDQETVQTIAIRKPGMEMFWEFVLGSKNPCLDRETWERVEKLEGRRF